MRLPRWISTVALGVVVAAVGAALAAEVAAAWLVTDYRPPADGVDPMFLPPAHRSSATWSEVHHGALVVLVLLAVVALVVTPASVAEEGRGPGRPIAVGALAVVGVLGAAAGVLTTALVEWDQVALTSVTTGTDLGGWGLAAFDERVRFVLVDGAEVTPGAYAVGLVVHLVAPAVALAALAAVGALVVRARRRDAALAATASTG